MVAAGTAERSLMSDARVQPVLVRRGCFGGYNIISSHKIDPLIKT